MKIQEKIANKYGLNISAENESNNCIYKLM